MIMHGGTRALAFLQVSGSASSMPRRSDDSPRLELPRRRIDATRLSDAGRQSAQAPGKNSRRRLLAQRT
jgi:hypothetical protein